MLSAREDSTREQIFSCTMIPMDDDNVLHPPRFSRVDFKPDDEQSEDDGEPGIEPLALDIKKGSLMSEFLHLVHDHQIRIEPLNEWLKLIIEQGYLPFFNLSRVLALSVGVHFKEREQNRLEKETAAAERRERLANRDAQMLAALATIADTQGKVLRAQNAILTALVGPRRHDG